MGGNKCKQTLADFVHNNLGKKIIYKDNICFSQNFVCFMNFQKPF